MQNAVEKEIQKETQKLNNAAENGLFLVTLQELNSLLCSSKAGENVSIAEMESTQDLHRLTQEDLITLFPAQKGDYTQLEILSSAAARATLLNQINKANAAFIVKAVNNHDCLIEILQQLIDLRGMINYDSIILNEALEALATASKE